MITTSMNYSRECGVTQVVYGRSSHIIRGTLTTGKMVGSKLLESDSRLDQPLLLKAEYFCGTLALLMLLYLSYLSTPPPPLHVDQLYKSYIPLHVT